jgi:hypothetical protein
MEDVELAPGATTLRLVLDEHRYIPEGARFPNGTAIEPSTDDAKEADRRGTPVRVSVWDRARTTIAQAVEIRRARKALGAALFGDMISAT